MIIISKLHLNLMNKILTSFIFFHTLLLLHLNFGRKMKKKKKLCHEKCRFIALEIAN